MELRPEGAKVIIKPDTAEECTSGGIIIPTVVKEQQQTAANRGEIVAIGPDAELFYCPDADGVHKMEMKPGDRVIFSRYGGSVINADTDGMRVEYRIVYDKDVICLISGEEEPDMWPTRKSMVT